MHLKKAMVKRITDKMAFSNQIEEQKSKPNQNSEALNRIVVKDKEGHVVKYLAKRVL